MSYPIKQLSQLCDIVIGRTPARKDPKYWGKGNKWVSISDLTSKVVSDTKEEITDYAVIQTRCRKVPKGTLLFSFKLTIGKMAFAGCDLYTNEAIAALHVKDKEELDAGYLYFVLQVAKLLGSNQAAMGKTLNSKSLAKIEIPVPDALYDQKRIVYLLSKVEGLITRRKQHLQQLDDLLKSIYLEMFGPQATGYEDWPLVEIKDLAAKHKGAMRTGPFGSNLLHSEFTRDGDVAVLGIDNAVKNRFAWGERRFITNDKYQELKKYRILPGDVIVTIMGTIGRSAVIPDDITLAINTKHLVAITLNSEIASPVFVSYSIHSSPYIHNQFKSKNRGAIMSGLNLGLIKETKLRRPPIELQDHFSAIHKRVDEVKVRYSQSLTDLENLYGALRQMALKGELDLSPIFVGAEEPQDEAQFAPDIRVPESTVDKVMHLSTPGPVEIEAFLDQEARQAMLSKWFDEYLSCVGKSSLYSVDAFMNIAQRKLWELNKDGLLEPDDEAILSLSWVDYDHIKDRVFLKLANGRMMQSYDEKRNRVCISLAEG